VHDGRQDANRMPEAMKERRMDRFRVGASTATGLLLLRAAVGGLDGVLAVGAALLLLGGGLLLGQRLVLSIQWKSPVRLLPEPVPEGWAEIVRRHFPLALGLRPEDFHRLLKLAQVFLEKKRIEGAGGLQITEEIRVAIAAQACFLLLWLEVGLYPGLKTILVYPSTVIPRDAWPLSRTGTFTLQRPHQPILGQSWRQGVVILTWEAVERGAADPTDGQNVVLHEFAHQLDQETGEADGIPAGLRVSRLKPWAHVIERDLGRLKAAALSGSETVLNPYGATNEAEFFAVATETFFEKPKQLRAADADLYALLSEYYGVDPANGLAPTERKAQGLTPPSP
jgi:Mlc titration factor MtfA (ptsG expression regulator)